MPLANEIGLVAGTAQMFNNGGAGERAVGFVGVAVEPGLVTLLAGEQNAAARGALGTGNDGIGEAHATGGEFVEVRRADVGVAGGAQTLPVMVVRNDEDQVRTAALLREERGGEQRSELAAREHSYR